MNAPASVASNSCCAKPKRPSGAAQLAPETTPARKRRRTAVLALGDMVFRSLAAKQAGRVKVYYSGETDKPQHAIRIGLLELK